MRVHVASPADVQAFLQAFKTQMAVSGLNLWKTAKNDAFLTDSGFTYDDVEAIVRTLEVRHYSAGPETDDNPFRPAGAVWKFCREYEGYELYVKLKVTSQKTITAECLSAHEQERPMPRPYW